ncbi:ATP-binding protein [Prevotella intermedia]|uniref:ATPase n=1 Tax=Prevotella intermedia TaxID=28131 RepID=A0A2G9IH16_PREIN|nr:ATP-binding protein [Prevotella intermedia]PIN29051.1 ATPase [Prevotella intermedia]
MLERKFTSFIERFLQEEPNKILLVNGARQIGKSYLIRHVGQKMFRHFVEINLKEDIEGDKVFADVHTTTDLYMRLSNFYSSPLGNKTDTLVFLDEIQSYPHLMTMLKFLNQESRYRFIASGSQLGVALAETPSVPLGSVTIEQMYPLDFEEFLWATGISKEWIDNIREYFIHKRPLDKSTHNILLKRFQYYLLIGGLPEAINNYLADRNMVRVRQTHRDIHNLYRIDASQYDQEYKLKIRKIYDLIPSNLENKKKRVVYKNIENKKGKTFSDYADEFEYLTNSGVALEVSAISNPRFPLAESEQKKLVKLYLNDVGLLTNLLYELNVNAVLQDIKSINLGTVYESVVAQELTAHGFKLHYYDNKKKGEVDFLVDDHDNLTVLPLEIKSGKDYTEHSALTKFLENPDYGINHAVVFSNEREIFKKKGVTYFPVYYCMFLYTEHRDEPVILPELEVI